MVKRNLRALLAGHPGRYLPEEEPVPLRNSRRKGEESSTARGHSSIEGRLEAAMMVLSWSDSGEGLKGPWS